MDTRTEITELKRQVAQQRKHLQGCTLGVVVGFCTFILSSTSGLQDLRIRRLALVDAKGIERVILVADSKTVNVNGRVYERSHAVSGVILQNTKGDEVGGMGTGDNGSAVIMLDGYSKTPAGESERVGIFVHADGKAGFTLNDLNGNQKIGMSSGPEADVEFEISHKRKPPKPTTEN